MFEIQKSDGPIPRTAISEIRAVSIESVSHTKSFPPGGMA